MDTLLQDLRYALRALRRSPGYSAVVVGVMALGIGVNTMVFSMVYAVLERPLPLPDPQRLVRIQQTRPRTGDEPQEVSMMNFRDFRTNRSFEHVGAFWDHNAFVTIDREPERLWAATVSYDLFDALGVNPILGRAFSRDEETWGKNWVPVLIGEKIWRERYHADPHVLGRPLRINGRVRTIVGVMPAGFRWPEIAQFWIPMGFDPSGEHRDDFALRTIGRLKPGVSMAQAEADLGTIMARIAREDPKTSEGVGVRVRDYRETMVSDIRPMMLLLLAAVGFVLLIACANVANLMLARAAGRRREISLRLSLGASRGRVIRQLLTESVVVAALGAGIGILLAHWGQRLWLATIPLEMPMWLEFRIDGPVLLFTAAITVGAGILFGLAPALHATDTHLTEALREGSAQAGASRGRNRMRAALVVAEVAFSLVLLVGTGLMLRSFLKRSELSGTVRQEGILTGSALLPVATYPAAEQRRHFFRTAVQRIEALPGVQSAAIVWNLPLGRNSSTQRVVAEGAPNLDPKMAPRANLEIQSPGVFDVLGIPLVAGRDFTVHDDTTSQRVAIVNQALAKKLWPGKDPLGRRIRFAGEPDSLGWATVVGVVATVAQSVEETKILEQAYVPHAQQPMQWMTFVIRSAREPAPLAADVRRILRSMDPDQALVDVRTMREAIRFAMWQHRLFLSLMVTFAALALLIAGVGIYGVMAYSVAQRTQEIGIRMALGAAREDVLRMVVGQAMRLTLIGCGIGFAGAYALTRLMASLLFQVSPTDPPTFAGVALILAISGISAAFVPAWRATRVEPMRALRCE